MKYIILLPSQQENILLKQRVEELKKQVSDLSTTNDFLLDQNAQLRLGSRVAAIAGCQPTGQSAVTTVVQAQPGGPLAVVPTIPPPSSAQVVDGHTGCSEINVGICSEGKHYTSSPQGPQQALGQLNQATALTQSPVVTISSITLAVPPPAMSMAAMSSMAAATSMSLAPVQTSIALAGPMQQTATLPTSMSLAGPIQHTAALPTSMSMSGTSLQATSAPLPTSMSIAGPLTNNPGQLSTGGLPNGITGATQQMQQTAPLPTTITIVGNMQQTNPLPTTMNMAGPPPPHPSQHPTAGPPPNGVKRTSQQTVSIGMQPLASAHTASSMPMPLQSHPTQPNVAPPSVMVSHSQAMQPPPPQQQTQQTIGPPPVAQSSMAQPPPPPPQHVPPPGMQGPLQQQPPTVSVAVAGATADTVTVRETRLVTYPISSIQAPRL